MNNKITGAQVFRRLDFLSNPLKSTDKAYLSKQSGVELAGAIVLIAASCLTLIIPIVLGILATLHAEQINSNRSRAVTVITNLAQKTLGSVDPLFAKIENGTLTEADLTQSERFHLYYDLAARLGRKKICDWIIARTGEQNVDKAHILLSAVKNGLLEHVDSKYFDQDTIDTKFKEERGRTALMIAAMQDDVAMRERLINLKANSNIIDDLGGTFAFYMLSPDKQAAFRRATLEPSPAPQAPSLATPFAALTSSSPQAPTRAAPPSPSLPQEATSSSSSSSQPSVPMKEAEMPASPSMRALCYKGAGLVNDLLPALIGRQEKESLQAALLDIVKIPLATFSTHVIMQLGKTFEKAKVQETFTALEKLLVDHVASLAQSRSLEDYAVHKDLTNLKNNPSSLTRDYFEPKVEALIQLFFPDLKAILAFLPLKGIVGLVKEGLENLLTPSIRKLLYLSDADVTKIISDLKGKNFSDEAIASFASFVIKRQLSARIKEFYDKVVEEKSFRALAQPLEEKLLHQVKRAILKSNMEAVLESHRSDMREERMTLLQAAMTLSSATATETEKQSAKTAKEEAIGAIATKLDKWMVDEPGLSYHNDYLARTGRIEYIKSQIEAMMNHIGFLTNMEKATLETFAKAALKKHANDWASYYVEGKRGKALTELWDLCEKKLPKDLPRKAIKEAFKTGISAWLDTKLNEVQDKDETHFKEEVLNLRQDASYDGFIRDLLHLNDIGGSAIDNIVISKVRPLLVSLLGPLRASIDPYRGMAEKLVDGYYVQGNVNLQKIREGFKPAPDLKNAPEVVAAQNKGPEELLKAQETAKKRVRREAAIEEDPRVKKAKEQLEKGRLTNNTALIASCETSLAAEREAAGKRIDDPSLPTPAYEGLKRDCGKLLSDFLRLNLRKHWYTHAVPKAAINQYLAFSQNEEQRIQVLGNLFHKTIDGLLGEPIYRANLFLHILDIVPKAFTE